jgi:hypothetical protein
MLPTELMEAAGSLATAGALNRSELFAAAVWHEIVLSMVIARRPRRAMLACMALRRQAASPSRGQNRHSRRSCRLSKEG